MRTLARGLWILGLVGAGALVSGTGGADPPKRGDAAGTKTPSPCARRHPGVGAVRAGAPRQGSTVALAQLGATTLAYVADEDDDYLRTIDVETKTERAVTPLAGTPSQLMVLADGRVAVALRDKNQIQILEPTGRADAPLETRCAVPAAAEPVGLAATPDDARLIVTSAWGMKLTTYDVASMTRQLEVDIPREPRGVVVDDDGERAFVAHVVGAKLSVVDLGAGRRPVREIDLRVQRQFGTTLETIRGSGCQGFALAKSIAPASGRLKDQDESLPSERSRPMVGRLFAPMVTVDQGERGGRSSGYGPEDGSATEVGMVSVVDAAAERALTRSVLGERIQRSQECILPRAAAVVADTGALLVACMGIDAIVELDGRGVDPSRLERRRWSVPAGPTGVAVDAKHERAVVWSQFHRTASVIALDGSAKVASIAVTRRQDSRMTPELAWGRVLFHVTDDARISKDGRACASCHPDGREDALTWSTPDGPRQTVMLAGRLSSSAPFGWTGSRKTLAGHVTQTFERLGGIGLDKDPSEEAPVLLRKTSSGAKDAAPAIEIPLKDTGPAFRALVAYLGSLRTPVPEPPPHSAELIARGRSVFFSEGQGACASCHVGGSGVDQQVHNVGAKTEGLALDTPSLRFVRGTAPYFHDGRYKTLEELLVASDHAMGHPLRLSQRDRTALTAYLETL